VAEDTIDALAIGITADADKAAKSLDRLITRLDRLEASCSAVSSLSAVEAKLASLSKTLDSANLSKLSELQKLKDVKLSATTANNLDKLVKSVESMPPGASDKITSIANALAPLSALKGVTISSTVVKRIKELPAALKEYEKLNLLQLAPQVNQLSNSLVPLANSTRMLGNAINALPKSYRTAAAAARTVTSSNKALAASADLAQKSTKAQATSLVSWYGKLATAGMVLQRAKTYLGGFITESNSYIENMNLFEASMGANTKAATEFGMKAQELLGIDFGQWARSQGVFQTLITGMGMASTKADVMSQQLTQLGYDIASFYNISVDEAMLKLQSGVAGELEPLRRIGWDLSDARMNLELSRMGIDATASSMTQAEKVALRYQMIMQQVTITHGDMARTIAAPANQIRVLQAQAALAARSIGNLLIPALNMILPVCIAAMKAVRLLAIELASFFGLDASFEVDYGSLDTSGIVSGADDAADATDNATQKVKELKNAVMGFDELNKLNDNSASGNGNGNDAGIGLDLPLDTYDFFEGLTDKIGEETDRMAQRMVDNLKKALPVVLAIGGGIAAWKIGTGLINGLGHLKSNMAVLRGDSDKVAKSLGRGGGEAGKLSSELARGRVSLSLFPGLARKLNGGLGGSIGFATRLLGAVGLAAGEFFLLYNHNEAFKRGLDTVGGLIANAFSGLPAAFLAGLGWARDKFYEIGDWVSNQGAKVVEFFQSLGIDLTPLINFAKGIGDAAEEATEGIGDLLRAADVDAESLGIVGACAAAATAIAGPLAGAIVGFAGILGLEVGALCSPVIEKMDALGDVSEETAERFGTSLDSITEAERQLRDNQFADDVVSQEDVDNIASRIQDVKDTILNNLDENRNEELASLDPLKGILSEERIEELKGDINAYYDEQKAAATSHADEIGSIYAAASAERRDLTAEEVAIIQRDNEQLKQQLVETSGATSEEIAKIEEAMRNNSREAAAAAASDILKEAAQLRDGEVEKAWDTYREKKAAYHRMRECGDITEEEYQRMVTAAEQSRDATVNAANDAYYGPDGVVERVKKGMGSARDDVDYETGEIKSFWQRGCENMSSAMGGAIGAIKGAWGGIAGWFNNTVVNPIKGFVNGMLGAVESGVNGMIRMLNRFRVTIPGWVPLIGGRTFGFNLQYISLPRFERGGFPLNGQLFVANESGPEMVGKMGSHNVVANNRQIVEGIEAGVIRAMLQVAAVTQSDDKREQSIEIPLVIGNEEIGRAAWKGVMNLVRRGELKMDFAY